MKIKIISIIGCALFLMGCGVAEMSIDENKDCTR
jgi:PBP1b-binding outer membrane lipoprotein LpoB